MMTGMKLKKFEDDFDQEKGQNISIWSPIGTYPATYSIAKTDWRSEHLIINNVSYRPTSGGERDITGFIMWADADGNTVVREKGTATDIDVKFLLKGYGLEAINIFEFEKALKKQGKKS